MNEELVSSIVGFLRSIGFEVGEMPLSDDTFLPGIQIESGSIFFDRTKLKYPGDLLHEAGHLAVVPELIRHGMSDKVEVRDLNENAIESAAMAWSYAASLHLGIDPRIVFHKDGYHGRAASLLMNFELGVFIGLNVLEEAGMAASPMRAAETGVEPFPAMVKWLRT